MKKVLIIVPKLSNGGIEKIASNFSMNLSDDIEQCVYSIMPQDKAYPFKVNPISLDVDISGNYIGKLYVFCRRVFLLRKLVKKNDIDTCISFGERCNIINLISGSRPNKVITIHSLISVENNAKGILGKIGGFLSKVLYRKAEQIVCVSEAVAED
ncbi:hypothetical protein L1D16_22345, partial [Vibrio sp. Isolate31]|uniref:glycosyltransferase n=1 Tax=Vibrio sp. Isolate31 TaxID=2908537 RepID=UPI001EFD9218